MQIKYDRDWLTAAGRNTSTWECIYCNQIFHVNKNKLGDKNCGMYQHLKHTHKITFNNFLCIQKETIANPKTILAMEASILNKGEFIWE